MENTKNRVLDKFTNLYSLSKTLRFELKPVGKTLDNLRIAMGWDEKLQTFLKDREIEDAYQILKPVFDKLHEDFITKSLENTENKKLFSFSRYFKLKNDLSQINRKEQEGDYKRKEKEFGAEEKLLRNIFVKVWINEGENFKNSIVGDGNEREILKEKGYKILTEAGILKYIKMNIDKFAELKLNTREDISWKKDNKNLVEKADLEKSLGTVESRGIFEGFFTYFSGFNQNRENYYSADEKATAVASRIIDENLPKFCDNVLEFEKRKNEILGADEFLKLKNIALTAKDQNGNEIELHKISSSIFDVNYFVNCLSQGEIEKYNLEIGNVNNLINRYNQQKSNELGYKKISKFKTLYKQIGCGAKGDFIQSIKTDDELKELFKDTKIKGEVFFKNINNLEEVILGLGNFKGVYWSDKALNTISGKYFANWASLKELLKNAKIFKKEKDEIKIPQTIELFDLFGVLDVSELVFKENFNENDELKQKILKSNEKNSIKLLKMIFVDVEENQNVFEDLKYKLPINDFKKDENTQIIKTWLDSLLNTNQILKYFKVRENKIKGNPLNAEVSEALNKILFEENPTVNYDIIRNYLTQKPTEGVNKLKLNFGNVVLAAGWDVNKEPERGCLILKDDNNKKYLAILTHKTQKFFGEKAKYKDFTDSESWQKMDYKLLPGPNKMLPKVLLAKSDRYKFGATDEILKIYDEGGFKKNEPAFTKAKLGKIVDFFKHGLTIYPSRENSWQDLFGFKFSDTSKYESVDQFYTEVEKQGYKLSWSDISKKFITEKTDAGEMYLFEIRNKDNNLKDGKEKSREGQNLHTIYWNAVFGNTANKPKLNGEAEIFYRPIIKNIVEAKSKDKNGKVFGASKKRFEQEKFVFHCPITLNFCLKSTRCNDVINKVTIENKNDVCFIGIDRGEKHLAYYSVVNQKGKILEQGSFNKINGQNYAKKLEEKAGHRDEARKNWKTIGTIKELKDGYISQVVRKIVDLAVKYNAYIVLEDLNSGFKRGRQKIEKSVYQKLELALAKKLNFVVDKKARDGEIGSVQRALQLTPPATNFADIEKAKQFGVMLYVRANYTSQTDPVTGWRKTIYFKSTTQENLKKEIYEKFNKIGFDGNDYYFEYKDENTGKNWKIYSGINGKSLDRFRGKKDNNGIWKVEKQDVVQLLNEVFGQQTGATNDLKTKITNDNVNDLKYAIDLIQQIRNTGTDEKDDDFILSSVRDKNNNHFDSRKDGAVLPNGDANGAYNIARKGILAFERINAKPEKPELYIADVEWDKWLQSR